MRPKQQVNTHGISKKSLGHEKSQDITFESTFAPRISPHEDFELKFDSDVYRDLSNKFIPMAFQKNHWDTRKVKTSYLYLIKAQNIHLNLHLSLESHHMKILSCNFTQTCTEAKATSLYPWHFKKMTGTREKFQRSSEPTFASRISPHEDIELKFDSDVYSDLNNKFILMAFQKNH